ncbi:hypothetical protein BCR42DRAFT_493942 [Absidia repens]|uniref:Arrestin-like N-terminal domain-containing protein n=1 Tax=Absidia repens TaxID=90262 RepID=A0A1X2I9A0_9FUNG|nr:hypothetical protein BCR42DRAFT_493942 [Absidia repens]
MFFKSAVPSTTLQLSISSQGLGGSIAYGPGSVINGTVFLKSSHPIQAQKLYIVFECQVHQHQKSKQQQQSTVLFSVTERIQLNEQNTAIAYDHTTTVVSAGTHMHLFAIQLPLVNYPPSIAEATFPGVCHIDYTLQAFLDRPELPTLFSDRIPLTYLPLIVAQMNDHETASRQQQHSLTMQPKSGGVSVRIQARMMQSAYCLGEQCTIQLTTDNPMNDKINQVYVTFMTRLYHDYPDQQQQHPSQHISYHQAVSISVPKQTKNHVSYVSIPIAQSCLPTFDYHHHQLGITMHHDDVEGNSSSHQPYFIPSNASSPIPSGTINDNNNNKDNLRYEDNGDDGLSDDGQYSVSPSSSFKLDDTFTTDDQVGVSTTPPPLDPSSSSLYHQHLTVPSHTNAAH